MYPALPKSYRGCFPFTLATTSFIYPDHIIPNVERLAPFVDEVELLFFECRPYGGHPPPGDIQRLAAIASQFGTTYNIHLPIDIDMGSTDDLRRCEAVDSICEIITLCAPLNPSTHTLHLPYRENSSDSCAVKRWLKRIEGNLQVLIEAGIDPKILSIETLDFPFEWLEPVITQFSLPVCIDIGHLIRHEFALDAVLEAHFDRTPIIHFHGVRDGRDHLSLADMPQCELAAVLKWLRRYRGVVSIEVFAYERLVTSLNHLEANFKV